MAQNFMLDPLAPPGADFRPDAFDPAADPFGIFADPNQPAFRQPLWGQPEPAVPEWLRNQLPFGGFSLPAPLPPVDFEWIRQRGEAPQGLQPFNPANTPLLPLPQEAYPPNFRYQDGTSPPEAPAMPQPILPYRGGEAQPSSQQRQGMQSPLAEDYIRQLVMQSLNPTPSPQVDFNPPPEYPQPTPTPQPAPSYTPDQRLMAAAQFSDTVRQNDNAILPLLAAAAYTNQFNPSQRRSERGEFDSLAQSPQDIAEQYRMNQVPWRLPFNG